MKLPGKVGRLMARLRDRLRPHGVGYERGPVRELWKTGAALVALAMMPLSGCADLSRFTPRAVWNQMRSSPDAFTEDDLRQALAEFASRFASVISGAAELATERTRNREVRRRALQLRINAFPLVEEVAFQDDPQQAYVSTLTLVVMLRLHLADDTWKGLFGDQQQLVADAVDQLENDLLVIGARFLTEGEIARMRTEVEAFARTRPVQPGFGLQGLKAAVAAVPTTSTFGWIINLPMSPFRALEGVSSGAAAIREFNKTALELTHLVGILPQQVRWQLELLLYDVEDRDTVMQTLAALQGMEQSADRASRAVESLPADLGLSLEASRGALADANHTIAEARALVTALDPTVQGIRSTSEIWAGLLQRDDSATSGREPGRPFDIREWENTAREISQAATSLQTLAVEFRTLSETQPNSSAVAEVRAILEAADVRARGIVDRAFWRLAALLVLFFGLLAAYRLTLGRGSRT